MTILPLEGWLLLSAHPLLVHYYTAMSFFSGARGLLLRLQSACFPSLRQGHQGRLQLCACLASDKGVQCEQEMNVTCMAHLLHNALHFRVSFLCLQVMDRVLRGDYSFPLSVPVSDSCKDLLKRILITDPALRITIEGIQQHSW